jgi:hypothetical protein
MHDPAWQRREAGKNKLRPPPQAYRGSRKKFTIAPVWSGLDCKSTIACDLLLVPLSGHLLKKGPAVKGAATLSHINQSQGLSCTGRAWPDPNTRLHLSSAKPTARQSPGRQQQNAACRRVLRGTCRCGACCATHDLAVPIGKTGRHLPSRRVGRIQAHTQSLSRRRFLRIHSLRDSNRALSREKHVFEHYFVFCA